MKVLLTGGAGFIGSHIAEAYVKAGYEVIIIDNLISGKIKNISNILQTDNVYFYKTDIKDKKSLEKIFYKHRPDIINHHAAQKSVVGSVEEPIFDAEVNIIGLLNLLDIVKDFNIKNFIYISSGGALSKEIKHNEKSKESDIPQLKSPYAISKYTGEKYIELYSNMYNFDYTILRYSNVYGPRQIPDGECGVIPIFISNILNNKKSTLFTYEDMPRGCSRDYVYVSDVVEINLLVTENSLNSVANVSSGNEVYILDIYNMIQEKFKVDIPILISGPRKGDIKRSVLDNKFITTKTNWAPKINMEQGIELLRKYYVEEEI